MVDKCSVGVCHTYFVGCDRASVWAHNTGGNCGELKRILVDEFDLDPRTAGQLVNHYFDQNGNLKPGMTMQRFLARMQVENTNKSHTERQTWTPLEEGQIRGVLSRAEFGDMLHPVRERLANPPLPGELIVPPPKKIVPGRLRYANDNALAEPALVELQAAGQAAGFNKVIEFLGGFGALKARAQKMLDDPAFRRQEMAEGRRQQKLWTQENPRPAAGQVPLHEADVGAGGLSSRDLPSLYRYGETNANSTIGGGGDGHFAPDRPDAERHELDHLDRGA